MDFLRSSVDRGSEKVIDVSRNMGRSSRIKEEIWSGTWLERIDETSQSAVVDDFSTENWTELLRLVHKNKLF